MKKSKLKAKEEWSERRVDLVYKKSGMIVKEEWNETERRVKLE